MLFPSAPSLSLGLSLSVSLSLLSLALFASFVPTSNAALSRSPTRRLLPTGITASLPPSSAKYIEAILKTQNERRSRLRRSAVQQLDQSLDLDADPDSMSEMLEMEMERERERDPDSHSDNLVTVVSVPSGSRDPRVTPAPAPARAPATVHLPPLIADAMDSTTRPSGAWGENRRAESESESESRSEAIEKSDTAYEQATTRDTKAHGSSREESITRLTDAKKRTMRKNESGRDNDHRGEDQLARRDVDFIFGVKQEPMISPNLATLHSHLGSQYSPYLKAAKDAYGRLPLEISGDMTEFDGRPWYENDYMPTDLDLHEDDYVDEISLVHPLLMSGVWAEGMEDTMGDPTPWAVLGERDFATPNLMAPFAGDIEAEMQADGDIQQELEVGKEVEEEVVDLAALLLFKNGHSADPQTSESGQAQTPGQGLRDNGKGDGDGHADDGLSRLATSVSVEGRESVIATKGGKSGGYDKHSGMNLGAEVGTDIGVGARTGTGTGRKIIGVGHDADLIPLTNAERMRIGLPLKPPSVLMVSRRSATEPSASEPEADQEVTRSESMGPPSNVGMGGDMTSKAEPEIGDKDKEDKAEDGMWDELRRALIKERASTW